MSETQTSSSAVAGSYRAPRFEHALVSDVMRGGVLTCSPDTPMVQVARTMCNHHVHCMVVSSPRGDDTVAGWKLLSDVDLLAVARAGHCEDLTAGESARSGTVTVTQADSVEHAAELMTDHQTAHLVVVDAHAHPIGMVSTLDIAGCVAWGLGIDKRSPQRPEPARAALSPWSGA